MVACLNKSLVMSQHSGFCVYVCLEASLRVHGNGSFAILYGFRVWGVLWLRGYQFTSCCWGSGLGLRGAGARLSVLEAQKSGGPVESCDFLPG